MHAPSRSFRRRVAVLAAAAAVGLAGCGPGASEADEPLDVLAASSLGPVLEELATVSPVPFRVSLAGSQVLEAQVRAGAPAALVLLADPERARALADDGLAAPPVTLATNTLVLVARPAAGVDGPEDLADRELRVILADGGVPLGDATQALLADLETAGALGPGGADDVLSGADSLEDSAASVSAKLVAGEADAAIVYATDALRLDGLDRIELPDAAPVTYTVQVLDDDPRTRELAAWLTSERARDLLADAGFLMDG